MPGNAREISFLLGRIRQRFCKLFIRLPTFLFRLLGGKRDAEGGDVENQSMNMKVLQYFIRLLQVKLAL